MPSARTDDIAYVGWLAAFKLMTRANLRGVWLHGQVPTGPLVWAANHHSWWDAFVAAAVLDKTKHRVTVVMDAENLEAFGFLKALGLVPHDQPRQGLQALADGKALVIMPEGVLRGPGPLGPIHRGAEWFAARAEVPLVPVALRITSRGHQRPEALVRVGQPVASGQLNEAMTRELKLLDDAIAESDPRAPLLGFRRVMRGRSSMDERVERLSAAVRR